MSMSRAALAVAYHAPAKRAFISEVIIPSVQRVAAAHGVEHAHMTRHWRFGPHIQVVATGADHDRLIQVLRTEQPRLTAAVAAHPSTYQLRSEQYLQVCEELGRSELVPGPYGPIWPDNSIQLLPEPLTPGLVTAPQALDLRDRFCACAVPALGSVLQRAERDPSQRLVGAAELMVLVAAAYPDGGLANGYLSYTSHLEDYLQDNDPDGTVRRDFQDRYAPVRPAFEALVAECVADLHAPSRYSGPDGALARWSVQVREHMAQATSIAGRGQPIDPLLHEDYMARAGELNDHLRRKYAVGDDREYSPFHQAYRGVAFTDVDAGRVFAAYRFLVNHLYTQLLLIDLSPAERLFLCHAIGQAVESLTGTTWQDKLLAGATGPERS